MVGSGLGLVISNPNICKRNILALMCYLVDDHQISKSCSNGFTARRGLTGGEEKQIFWSRWEAGKGEMAVRKKGRLSLSEQLCALIGQPASDIGYLPQGCS